MTDYTPSMADLRAWTQQADSWWSEAEFDRAIAAHDAALRAEIAGAIRADLQDTEDGNWPEAYINGIEHAATIAEGRTP